VTLAEAPTPHAALMDRVYRHQRHVYDLTRKYYLLGRDLMIERLDVPRHGAVLEIGCGTGRNMLEAMNRYPSASWYGLDISEEMLATARRTLVRRGRPGEALLVAADATDFDAEVLFGRPAFDRVYISYALSMIPDWRAALTRAVDCVVAGGSLHIIDFGQQERLPGFFRSGLHAWLKKFHVEPRAALFEALADEAARIGGHADCTPLHRGYAWHAILSRSSG
jgi:S-adenosylmethionine-diacylgycerolhomoserine-N-methlytransferase